PGRRVGLLSVVLFFVHRLADLGEPFGGGALALVVLLLDGAALRGLGVEFGRAGRRAVAGFDLLAHRFERRHAAGRVAGVDGLDRRGARRGLLGWFRFGSGFVRHVVYG